MSKSMAVLGFTLLFGFALLFTEMRRTYLACSSAALLPHLPAASPPPSSASLRREEEGEREWQREREGGGGRGDRVNPELQVEESLAVQLKMEPSFKMVLGLPFHPGGIEIQINATRQFIPIATSIYKYALESRCQDDPSTLLVDVGANIGYVTGLGQALGCTVLSFEPYPDAFRDLRASVLLNPNSDRVYTHPVIVSSQFGMLSMTTKTKLAFNSVTKNGNLRIASVPLDAVISRDVAVLKIDVEGHEASVLEGAKETFRSRKIDHIVIEMKREGEIEKKAAWLNDMIEDPSYKVYAFRELYDANLVHHFQSKGLNTIERMPSYFKRISSPIDLDDWLPYEDVWITKDSPFDF